MTALLPQPDPDGLLEYSVVYTDRALNHMSQRFQGVMSDISRLLEEGLQRPLGRHRAGQRHLRHGGRRPPVRHRVRRCWSSATAGSASAGRRFSTWAAFPPQVTRAQGPPGRQRRPGAVRARPDRRSRRRHPRRNSPAVVFAPHVETASGMMLPDGYLQAVATPCTRSRRPVRARLHRLGHGVGGHGGQPASTC